MTFLFFRSPIETRIQIPIDVRSSNFRHLVLREELEEGVIHVIKVSEAWNLMR
jgi:hypothetical protein